MRPRVSNREQGSHWPFVTDSWGPPSTTPTPSPINTPRGRCFLPFTSFLPNAEVSHRSTTPFPNSFHITNLLDPAVVLPQVSSPSTASSALHARSRERRLPPPVRAFSFASCHQCAAPLCSSHSLPSCVAKEPSQGTLFAWRPFDHLDAERRRRQTELRSGEDPLLGLLKWVLV
jgi:hypothetical protein